MKCEKCLNEHDGTFGSGRFCSRNCANVRIQSKETKQKRSETIKRRINEGKIIVNKLPRENRLCSICKKEFIVIITSHQITCGHFDCIKKSISLKNTKYFDKNKYVPKISNGKYKDEHRIIMENKIG